MMKIEFFFRIGLFVAGMINFMPGLLAVLPDRISKSYGIATPDASLELLLRHRAVFFAMIGGLMLYAAISKNYMELSAVLGLVSMISFILLYFLIGGEISQELSKVMKIDVFALLLLLISFVLYKIS